MNAQRPDDVLERLKDALRPVRCAASATEMQLHEQVEAAFAAAGFLTVHEARLSARCRIDFLVEGVGVEIKKSRPNPAQLRRQLARYAACEQVAALLVIAPRGVNLPREIGGKPVAQLALERLWGICLP